MDMFNVSPPPSASGMNDLAMLAQLFVTQDGVKKKLDALLEYTKDAGVIYEKASVATKEANKTIELAVKAQDKAASEIKVVERAAADLSEKQLAFSSYQKDVLNEIEADREELETVRKQVAAREDAVVEKERKVTSSLKQLSEQMAAFEEDKKKFAAKLEAVKGIGL